MTDAEYQKTDPWEWNVDNIVDFFCRPSTTHLPIQLSSGKAAIDILASASKTLESVLRECEVDGAALLMYGDDKRLKDLLGISNFALRSTLAHEVRELRKKSKTYLDRLCEMPKPARSDQPYTPPDSENPSADDVSPNKQPTGWNNKNLIQPVLKDKPFEAMSRGDRRKRRKVVPTQTTVATSARPISTTNYFLGQQKTSLRSLYSASGCPQDGSESDDNFKILKAGRTFNAGGGLRLFTKNRLQYLFRAGTKHRSGSHWIVKAHPKYLSKGGRLAMMYSASTDTTSPSLVDAKTLQEQSTEDQSILDHDWSFLDHWVKRDQKDHEAGIEPHVYPAYLESGDEDDYEESLLDEFEAEGRARETIRSWMLLGEAVKAIVDDELNIKSEAWKRDKLPKLEAKSYQVWVKGCSRGRKGSIYIRQTAKEAAELETRLLKLRKSIEEESWTKESEVRRMCQTLEVTLYRQLELEWRTKLWRGPQPAQVAVEASKSESLREPKGAQPGSDADSEDVGSDSDAVSNEDDFVLADQDPLLQAYRTRIVRNDQDIRSIPAIEAKDIGSPSVAEINDQHLDHPKLSLPRNQVEVIDLTLMDDSEKELRSKSASNNTNIGGSTDASSNLRYEEYREPNDATKEQVDRWSYYSLAVDNDSKRFIYKALLSEFSSSTARDVSIHVEQNTHPTLKNDIEQALAHVSNCLYEAPESEKTMLETKLCLARLWIYWVNLCHATASATPPGPPDADDVAAAKDLLTADVDTVYDIGELTNFLESIRSFTWLQSGPLAEHSGPRQKSKRKRKASPSAIKVHARQMKAARRQAEADRLSRAHQAHQHSLIDSATSQPGTGEIINLFRSDEANDPYIQINSHISSKLKPHQLDGVRFLWREITQTFSQEDEGCLLAHTMGLGKTLQVIAFLVTLTEVRKSTNHAVRRQLPMRLRSGVFRVLILCPPGILENWEDELRKWVPNPEASIGFKYSMPASPPGGRMVTLKSWYESGGILIIGYNLFRTLSQDVAEDIAKHGRKDITRSSKRMLLEGPSIVIADEAQNFKNPSTKLGRAIGNFATRSRIAMTGSPLSNHCQEYFAMIDWVAPGYLGTYEQFNTRYRLPIEQGFYVDSSPWERRKALTRLKALNDDITPKVHRKDVTAMEGSLKPKIEFVMTLSMTDTQKSLYNDFVDRIKEKGGHSSFLTWSHDLERLLSHPAIFLKQLEEKKNSRGDGSASQSGIDFEDCEATERKSDESSPEGDSSTPESDAERNIRLEFSATRGAKYDTEKWDYTSSVKLQILRTILTRSMEQQDKVLIFCTLIPVLQYLEGFVRSLGLKALKFDGTTKMTERQMLTKSFNSDDTDVFLISTKAGGVGLNIHGANRVVIFSFGFNPTDEDQAVGRAYRLGQTKPVYVYHFVTGGTVEEVVFNRALFKRQLQIRVVDKKKPTSAAEKGRSGLTLVSVKETRRHDLSEFRGKDIIMDEIMDTTDSLLQLKTTEVLNREVDEPLDDDELKEVQSCIDENRLRRSGRLLSRGIQSSPPKNAALDAQRARRYPWLP